MRPPQFSRCLSRWVCRSCTARLRAEGFSARQPPPRDFATLPPSKLRVPEAPARTRFAPSPTGNLHLGSIRTALFNYLLARRTKGQFLLRIEDTDQKRTVPGAEEKLYKDLRWAGLEWDEGPTVGGSYGPYRQSERNDIYHSHVENLITGGKAYRCFCTAERLDKLNRSRHARGLPLGYDRHCASIPREQAGKQAENGQTHVVRFRLPKAYPKYVDVVYGRTGQGADRLKKLHLEEPVYDDPVLIKSDGFPTYHFANVVDDQLMKITHVIRGSEWMSSTPLHVALYEAFGWTPPAFAHVPLLTDKNGQKLSKRNFNSDISTFRDRGIFPAALVNFAALLGWSHQKKSDVMDLKDLEEAFDLKITKGNTIVAFGKLQFLQEQHAKRKVAEGMEEFEQMIRDIAVALLEEYGAATVTAFIGRRQLRDVVASLLRAESLPYTSASDFAKQCAFLLNKPKPEPLLLPTDTSVLGSLRIAAATLCLVPGDHWTAEVHRANMAQMQPALGSIQGVQMEKQWRRDLYHYLRWALLGGVAGPSLPQTMEILGRDACVDRIQKAALEMKDIGLKATRACIQPAVLAN